VNPRQLERAAQTIREASALLVGAGAGMGVDSGLPDFRGKEGFWRAYPPFRRLGLGFQQLANPAWFVRDPELAWGFYGHRLRLYRDTTPHAGFDALRNWAESRPLGGFVFTSNVDGQFQKAGFDPGAIVEVHGSIHYMQCSGPCCADIWTAEELGIEIEVDPASLRARPPLPECPHCGAVARPNILMFGDGEWIADRTATQLNALTEWVGRAAQNGMALVECGAGTAVPTVRNMMESLLQRYPRSTLVRINRDEPAAPTGSISLAGGALDALTAIDALLD
jgi:NAD-dependent SIR2 family protein deacetylase